MDSYRLVRCVRRYSRVLVPQQSAGTGSGQEERTCPAHGTSPPDGGHVPPGDRQPCEGGDGSLGTLQGAPECLSLPEGCGGRALKGRNAGIAKRTFKQVILTLFTANGIQGMSELIL